MHWLIAILFLLAVSASADEVLLPKPKPSWVERNVKSIKGGVTIERGPFSVRGPKLPKPNKEWKSVYGVLFRVRF